MLNIDDLVLKDVPKFRVKCNAHDVIYLLMYV